MGTLSRPIHQVFINFRGNLRYGFVSHLTDALKRHNINFFIDTHEQKGRDLKHLFKRIEEATVALVILSTRYAESKWCLDELTKIMDQAEKMEIIVIPIFYKVKPKDVELQEGVFGDRFWSHADQSSREEMEKWQVALKAVCNKVGITLYRKRYEAKFIKKVVKEVEKVLTSIQSGEGRENHCVKVKTFKVPLALPWTWSWFGSAVGLVGTVLGLLSEIFQCEEGREDDSVKKVKTFNVPLALPWSWFSSAAKLIGAVLGLLIETVRSDEGREDDCVKKVKTFKVPLALPWSWSWFGSAVGLIGTVLGLLSEIFQCEEGREDDCVKKVKTFNVPLALPWLWFSSAVKLIGAVLGLLIETVRSDEGREDGCVKKVKIFNVPLALPWLWFGSVVEMIGAMLGLLIETVRSDEGREDDCVKKVKIFNVPLAMPWIWFGSAVELVGAVLGLLNETVHKCASPAMVILASQVGSVVAISSRWADKSV